MQHHRPDEWPRGARAAARAAGALALIAGLSACEGEVQRFDLLFDPCVPLVLEPDPDATSEQVAVVEEAIAMWREVAEVATTTDEVEGARSLAVSFPEDVWYYGRFNDVTGGLEVASWIEDPEAMAVILAHELGHAYNLYHVRSDDRPSVMNAGNVDIEPTPEDGEALAGLWGDCSHR